jgi:hypothetical protein
MMKRLATVCTTALEMHVTADCVTADKQCGRPVVAPDHDDPVIEPAEQPRDTGGCRQHPRIQRDGQARDHHIYFGGGPPDKYRVTGQTQPTDWQTGQPMLNADYIVCTQIQVVYPGVNITSPSTCAQSTFS